MHRLCLSRCARHPYTRHCIAIDADRHTSSSTGSLTLTCLRSCRLSQSALRTRSTSASPIARNTPRGFSCKAVQDYASVGIRHRAIALPEAVRQFAASILPLHGLAFKVAGLGEAGKSELVSSSLTRHPSVCGCVGEVLQHARHHNTKEVQQPG